MSQDAKNLYQAQQEAASMAEILEKDIDSLDNISVYYDKDWNQCDKEEKMYWLEVTQAQNQAQEDDLKKVKIAVYSGENSKGESSKKEEIYHLNLKIRWKKNTQAVGYQIQYSVNYPRPKGHGLVTAQSY